jgi:hypothetical protein
LARHRRDQPRLTARSPNARVPWRFIFGRGCDGLAYVTRTLPIGAVCAVWVGIRAEAASPVKIVLIVGLVDCVIGLKLVGDAA